MHLSGCADVSRGPTRETTAHRYVQVEANAKAGSASVLKDSLDRAVTGRFALRTVAWWKDAEFAMW